MHAKSLLFAVLVLGVMNAGHAAQVDAMAARIMYSAWQCSTYAELGEDTAQQSRLFMIGYEKGKQFMKAVVAGTITEEEGRTVVPLAVGLLMAGPTPEFALGRIFASAADDAFDAVTARDANGLPLAPKDYVVDRELRKVIASKKFLQANCEILE